MTKQIFLFVKTDNQIFIFGLWAVFPRDSRGFVLFYHLTKEIYLILVNLNIKIRTGKENAKKFEDFLIFFAFWQNVHYTSNKSNQDFLHDPARGILFLGGPYEIN